LDVGQWFRPAPRPRSLVLDALRSNGYKPTLRIEDVEVDGDGPVPE
jgi:hypothetical protein